MATRQSRGRRGNNEGTIFEDKARNRWKAGVTLSDGSRRWVTGKTREAVAQKLAVLLGQSATGAPIPKAGTVGDQIRHWRDYTLPAKHLAPATVENYRWSLEIVETHLGAKRLATLTPEQVEKFLRDRVAEGYTANSVRLMRTTLGQVLKEAERRGHVQRNVGGAQSDYRATRRRRPSGAHSPPRKPPGWSPPSTGDSLEAFFVLALTTGARRGELLGLSWDDVDLKAGTMTMRHGAPQGAKGWLRGRPDQEQRQRPHGAPRRQRHRRAAPATARSPCVTSVSTTSCSPRSTGAHLDPSRLRRRWDAICTEAGLEGVVLHELRHTAGSVAVDAGVALTEVADQLGHADVSMLATVYRHRTRPVVEGVAGVMENFVAAEKPKRKRAQGMNPPRDVRWLDFAEAVALLGVGARTLERLVAEGRLPRTGCARAATRYFRPD